MSTPAEGLRLAVTTLTIAPVRGPERLDREVAGWAMTFAPVVGLLLAAPLVGLLVVADRLVEGPALLASVLAVAAGALLTRGLHLDGLGDLVDGLASYGPPEQTRAVMKQPDVGALGAAALVLVPAVQVAALLACLQAGRGPYALLLAFVTGRLAVTVACTPSVPAATQEGLGALVAGTVPGLRAAGAVAVVVAVATVLAPAGQVPLLLPAAAVASALAATALLLRHVVRRVGGLTGDVLGALVEICTAVVLVVLSISP